MNIEKEMLENCSLNKSALLDYGFIKCQELYKYSTKIMNNKFRVDLTIDSNGKITGKIFDLKNLEEYTNFRIKNFGSFLATVVEEYRKVLKSVIDTCYIKKFLLMIKLIEFIKILLTVTV